MADAITSNPEASSESHLQGSSSNFARRIIILTAVMSAFAGFGYVVWGISVRRSAEHSLRAAAQALKRDNPAAARESLKWLLWFEPQHPGGRHLVGMSYLKDNNLSAAKDNFQQIGRKSPLYENAQTLLAGAFLADQQFDEADTVLTQTLRQYPHLVIACRQLSGLYLTELRSRDAVQVIEDYLRRMLSRPIVLSDFLLLLRDLGSAEFHAPTPQDCLATLNSAIKRHPDQPEVQLALANCRLRLGQLDEAGQSLEIARRLGASGWEFQMTECSLWLAKGDAERAESALARPGQSDQSSAGNQTDKHNAMEADDRCWELKCRIAELRGDADRALSDLDRAVKLRPFSKEHHSRRARLLQKLRRTDESQPAYERSHELAKTELELWRLTRDLGVRTPTVDECRHVAALYKSIGRSLPAEAWYRLGTLLAQSPPTQ